MPEGIYNGKFKNIVEKQQYWDSLPKKYGSGIKYRQDILDYWNDTIPTNNNELSGVYKLGFNLPPELNKYDELTKTFPPYSKDNYSDLGGAYNVYKKENVPYLGYKGIWDDNMKPVKNIPMIGNLQELNESIEKDPNNKFTTEQKKIAVKDLFLNNKNVKDPAFLYANFMEEGGNKELKNIKSGKNPILISGFKNFGLDRVYEDLPKMVKEGYLSKDFGERLLPLRRTNEKKEKVISAAFKNYDDIVNVMQAYFNRIGDKISDYERKNNIKLSDRGRKFFSVVGYNGGLTNMLKMLNAYKSKGLLNNDEFTFKNKYEGYNELWKNAKRRLDLTDMVAGELLNNNDMGEGLITELKQNGK